jgi:ribosome recycling factor
MSAEVESYLTQGYELMDKSLEHLNEELSKIRAGKASPSMVSSIMVDYYGSSTPLPQIANVTTSDARTISIQPWEKSMLAPIERAIFEANMGMTPMNNGEVIILQIPPVTEERRLTLVKQCKALGEDAKVSVRNVRHKLMEHIKKEVKNGFPEDLGKKKEVEVQKMVDNHSDQINKLIEAKEKEVMKV